MSIVRIWCDGRVKTNPGLAGWAALLDYNGVRKMITGNAGDKVLTNNQAQIEAVIFALEHLKHPCEVEIVSDSQYVVNVGNWTWQQKSNFAEWKRFEQATEPHDVILIWRKELTSDEQRLVRTKAISMIGAVTV